MKKQREKISRREFLKLSALGLGALAINPAINSFDKLADFPQAEYLGRNTVYSPNSIRIWSKPSSSSTVIRTLQDDECVAWLRDVVGDIVPGRINRRWVETSEGYIYASSLQPVKNKPNLPVSQLTVPSDKGPGMWAEVTIPYVNLQLANPPSRAPWLAGIRSRGDEDLGGAPWQSFRRDAATPSARGDAVLLESGVPLRRPGY